MTYSVDISLAALSKLQQIVEQQKSDQELLARVLTDAVEHFERNRRSEAIKIKVTEAWVKTPENPTPPPELFEKMIDNARKMTAHPPGRLIISADQEHRENLEKREERRKDKAEQLKAQLAKVHEAVAKLDEKPTIEDVSKLEDSPFKTWKVSNTNSMPIVVETKASEKKRSKWGSGKSKHDGKDYTEGADKAAKSQIRQQDPLREVIDKRIKEGIDPHSNDKPLLPAQKVTEYKNGMPCLKCKKKKPGRWMERKKDKYTGWCQNCANDRDQIDRQKPLKGVEF